MRGSCRRLCTLRTQNPVKKRWRRRPMTAMWKSWKSTVCYRRATSTDGSWSGAEFQKSDQSAENRALEYQTGSTFQCRLTGRQFTKTWTRIRPGAGHPQWQLPGSRKIFAVEGPQCCDPIGFIPSTMLTLATGNFESGLRNWSVAAKAWFELVSRNHSLASRVQSHHLSGVKKR